MKRIERTTINQERVTYIFRVYILYSLYNIGPQYKRGFLILPNFFAKKLSAILGPPVNRSLCPVNLNGERKGSNNKFSRCSCSRMVMRLDCEVNGIVRCRPRMTHNQNNSPRVLTTLESTILENSLFCWQLDFEF
jgi:hypothetical protein